MEAVIWIVQILLATVFLLAGLTKLGQPREKLVEGPMAWAGDFSDVQVKGIGALEVLAAIGLILPAALGVVPVLTALAAAGLVLVMIGAARTHVGRGEAQMVPANLVLGALALFVAIERFGPHSL
ncbi:MAG TPA: DoxX family protein [Baekduia sp.]|uniref:DoxX family protein n=1 Tax=Baekduia sp. TaxID=2600305 RepID=UPI002D768FA8|nr:DoxX family protein [Baekduia sp.]HET6509047.1 DoxX family protein [Baekduia sp.]